MSKEKDLEESLQVVQKYADHLAILPSDHPRLCPINAYGIGVSMTPLEAIAFAKKEKAIAVATGSFYIMPGIYSALGASENISTISSIEGE